MRSRRTLRSLGPGGDCCFCENSSNCDRPRWKRRRRREERKRTQLNRQSAKRHCLTISFARGRWRRCDRCIQDCHANRFRPDHYSGRKSGIKSGRPTGRSESDPMMEVNGSERRRKGNILHHFRYEWSTSILLLLKRRGLFITALIGRVNGHQISAYKGWNQPTKGKADEGKSIFRRNE